VRLVAESFAWPFRGAWRGVWAIGLATVLLLPLLFIPLLGYAIAAVRAAERDPSTGPPAWRISDRLIADGAWVFLALLVTWIPFAFLVNSLAPTLRSVTPGEPFTHLIALLIAALPWGIVALLLLPHATARFAASGKRSDMFNAAAAIRGVRSDFATWNVVVAAIVTAWAIGVACVGLLCVGIVPGVFYAILVSAHATAALHHDEAQGAHPDLPPG
jgi:uncharacterized protein DUF4013